MPVSLRLAIRQWLTRPLRPVLCTLAIAAAVALVVCVGAGFDSLRASLREGLGQMLGLAEVHVRPAQRGTDARLPGGMLEQIRARPEVALASGRMQAQVALNVPGNHRWFEAVGIDAPLDDRLRPKRMAGGVPLGGGADEILIDQSVASVLPANVGDTVTLETANAAEGAAPHPMRVVGIVKRPQIEFLVKPTVYLPMATLAAYMGGEAAYNVIDVKLKAEPEDLPAYTRELTKALGPEALAAPSNSRRAQFDQETRSLNFGLILLSIVSGGCAALIIGTTLSVGVQERIRQFGQFRCIGASRRQLVEFVAADALLLAAAGVALGFVFGLMVSGITIKLLPNIFLVYQLRTLSIVVAVCNGIGATAVGSLAPMWQVTRVTPMEAIRAAASRTTTRQVWLAGLGGLAAVAMQILLWQIPGREVRFWTYACAGIPLIFAGYCLAGPALLLLLERAGAHVIGGLLGVRPALLRQSWSRTPWRAGAMVAALMIGVTLLTAVRARGEGLLMSWTLPNTFPDMLAYNYYGIPLDRAVSLKSKMPQIKDATVFSAFPVRIERDMFRIGSLTARPEMTQFVAVEPESFRNMVELEFVQGDPNTAWAELAQGKVVFVSREYNVARGIGVGDVIPLQGSDGLPVDFRVAAVVTSNVVDVAKSYFDMRTTLQEAAVSSVLGTVADGEKYFKLKNASAILLNVNKAPGQTSEEVMEEIRPELTRRGFESASALELKDSLRRIIVRIVDAISLVAVAALCLASLGVANMVIASIHARRFEFGVLRAIGAGRGQLVRLILAEVLLISLTAGVLGSIAGLHLAFMGTRVDRLLVGFVWQFPVTWTLGLNVGVAILITVLLGWMAAIVPAWRGANAAQRALLASGRG